MMYLEMAKKAHRRHTRKSHKQHKRSHKKHSRRMTRKKGGAGAPVNYSLAGNWSSRMSLGQGQDFFKYHEGQHGGQAPYPGSVESSSLPVHLRGPAHLAGIDKAFVDIAGLKDQTGGKRKKHHRRASKTHRRKTHHKKQKKHHKRHTHRRRRGGGYAPVTAPSMLLSGPKAYAQAGLNPEWKTDVAFEDAKLRDQA
jgi:hypothetical protein